MATLNQLLLGLDEIRRKHNVDPNDGMLMTIIPHGPDVPLALIAIGQRERLADAADESTKQFMNDLGWWNDGGAWVIDVSY